MGDSRVLISCFSECGVTEQIVKWQLLRARFFGFDFYQLTNVRIEPGTAWWEARTLPLCYAVDKRHFLEFHGRIKVILAVFCVWLTLYE